MARGNASHANNNHAVHAPSNNYVPPQIRAGGAPARKYLNEKVVPYLLEGMKSLAQEQ
jgi:COMPASS component SDC1